MSPARVAATPRAQRPNRLDNGEPVAVDMFVTLHFQLGGEPS